MLVWIIILLAALIMVRGQDFHANFMLSQSKDLILKEKIKDLRCFVMTV